MGWLLLVVSIALAFLHSRWWWGLASFSGYETLVGMPRPARVATIQCERPSLSSRIFRQPVFRQPRLSTEQPQLRDGGIRDNLSWIWAEQ